MRKAFLFLICTVFLFSCKEEDSTNNFRIPFGTNGIKFHDGLLYITDIIGQSITAFDPINGVIQKQYDFRAIEAGPDDLIFMDDGTIIWTAPLEGFIGKITNDGSISIIADGIEGVNPIERTITDERVFVGYFTEDEIGRIAEVNINSGEVVTIVDSLPRMNGFSFAEDGFLYAPLFDLDNLFQVSGGVIKVDVNEGSAESFEVDFPHQPNKNRLRYTSGIVSDRNGSLYVLESVNPKIYKVNLSHSEATIAGSLPTETSDNIALGDDDKIYVTTFIQNIVFEIDQNGNRRRITIRN